MMIQKLRLQRGWSQQQLAELAGLSTRTIQRLERGEAASVESLKALAAVFEVDFQSLQPQAPAQAGAPSESTMQTTAPTLASATEYPANPQRAHAMELEEQLAFRQVRRMMGFYRHLAIYLLVMGGSFLWTTFMHTGAEGRLWRPALGWGVAVLVHGLVVFSRRWFFSPSWEKKQVEKILGREL